MRAFLASTTAPVVLALLAAAVMLLLERRGRLRAGLWPAVAVLVPCTLAVARLDLLPAVWVPLLVALLVAGLAWDPADRFAGECALKLLWVMGGAFALTGAGLALLALATSVHPPAEQWSVLTLGLAERTVWSVAVPLALLGGVVLLGAAPFHFWVADLLQGLPTWLAPLAVAALQGAGARWLQLRLDGAAAFPDGADLAGLVLRTAAAAALVGGAGTLLTQRDPERRAGTFASLQGGLALATLSAALARGDVAACSPWLVAWVAHLALALTGAAVLGRYTPATRRGEAPGGGLFLRHPVSALVGIYALMSLAGIPGTPGAWLWLETARDLVATGRSGLLAALALGWIAAFAAAVQQLRDGFGLPAEAPAGERAPWQARLALWLSGAGLAATGLARLLTR